MCSIGNFNATLYSLGIILAEKEIISGLAHVLQAFNIEPIPGVPIDLKGYNCVSGRSPVPPVIVRLIPQDSSVAEVLGLWGHKSRGSLAAGWYRQLGVRIELDFAVVEVAGSVRSPLGSCSTYLFLNFVCLLRLLHGLRR